MIRDCETCQKKADCRPYGKNGSWICFACGMSDLEETNKNFISQLGAAGPKAILTDHGPVPYDKKTLN